MYSELIGNNKSIRIKSLIDNIMNSGVWTDFRITSVEDQQKFLLPLNRDTELIYYNQRMLIDAGVLTEPRAWTVSKVNRLSSRGVSVFTCAQSEFDQHKDYIELDNDGNVIGMWADYFTSEIPPIDAEPSIPLPIIRGEFTYSAKPQIKVGGSYKKFTLTFFKNDEVTNIPKGYYLFTINNEDASELVSTIEEDNTIKVKFNGDDSWIGKTLTIEYRIETGISTTVDAEIIGL